MKEREASCSCGQLRLVASGDPVRVSICHCRACQRRTGSVFGVQARFPADRVRIKGDARTYLRVGDGGGEIRFRFCPQCGATVCYSLAAYPDVIAVPVGAFADPGFPAPGVSVYEARRHPWVAVPDGVEHFD
jgi:hypothetical protein